MLHLENDLSVAGFLLVKGYKLLGLELVGTRYAFVFDDSEQDAVMAAFEYTSGALVPANQYAEAIKQLKSALYAEKFKENRNGRKLYKHS
jgi:hypothetical protein